MAPEKFRLEPFDGAAVDVWSAGVTLFMMLSLKRMYKIPHIVDDKLSMHAKRHEGFRGLLSS